jgi:hypothetical protein
MNVCNFLNVEVHYEILMQFMLLGILNGDF